MNLSTLFYRIIRFSGFLILLSVVIPLSGQEKTPLPVIRIVDPSPGDSLNNSGMILVRVEILSDTPLNSYRISNNKDIVASENKTKLVKRDSITFNVENFVYLKKGLNTIMAEAKNTSGTVISEKRIIICQPEPFISWISPALPDTYSESGLYEISAEIKSDLALKEISININRKTIKCDEGITKLNNNTYILKKTVPIDLAKNSIVIMAGNTGGFTMSTPRTVRLSSLIPAINIISPLPTDSLNNSGAILVAADIISNSPLIAYSVNVNGVVVSDEAMAKLKDSITYSIESYVYLKKGINTIMVEAKNNTASNSSEKRIIICQPEPFINWISPFSNDSISESGLLKVKAEIKSDLALKDICININGVNIKCDERITKVNNNTYILEKTVPIDRPKNLIVILAGNTSGVTRSSPRTVRITSLIPSINIINPLPDDTLNNSGIILVSADVVSRLPLKGYNIYVNDNVVADDNMAKPKIIDSITYSLENLIYLKKGLNTVKVEAKNTSATGTSDKRFIRCQPEPFISWISPLSPDSFSESGLVKIKAEIRSDLALKDVIININGESIKCEDGITKLNNNTYSLEKTVPGDNAKNSIAIMASNTAGITRSSPRIVRVPLGPVPFITVNAPSASDTLNNTGMILVSADILSSTPLLSYRIINNENLAASEIIAMPKKKDSITYLIESFVPLKGGLNTISLEARNSSGTSIAEKRYVKCQLEPIIKWILPGTVNSITGSERFNIKAELMSSFDIQETIINLNDKPLNIEKSEITRLSNNVYSFEKKIPLNRGENSIVITAANAQGKATSAMYVVTYKPEIISEISWIAPEPANKETNSAELTLTAIIKTNSEIKNAALFVNEKEIAPGGRYKLSSVKPTEYTYENSIVLNPGINTIYISAITKEGNINSEKRTVNYIVPILPVLAWKSPSPDQLTVSNPSVDIRIEIKSNTRIEGLTIYINSKITGSEDLIKDLRKEEDAYVLEKSLMLNNGTNSIYIVAKNLAGIATSETRSLTYTYSSVPVVSWVSPSNPSTDINLATARIKLKIQSSDKLESLLAYVNGSASEEVTQLVSGGIAGEYSLEKPVNLQPGKNEIYFIATNHSGTTKSDIRYLTNPPTNPPIISWINPTDSKVIVNSEMVMIEACIKSATILKSIQLLVNGVQQASELVFPQPGTGECNYRFTKSVILKNGENSVYIIAENFAGSSPSEKRSLRYDISSMIEKRLALVFGNAEYSSSNSLRNPVNDANLMEGTLKGLGFDVIKKINASKSEMEGALREFSNKLPQYNVALFYYAGHGVQVEGENYLVPVDAMLENKTDCQWEALPVERIIRQFEQVPENINIVILDACRDNPFRSWSRGSAQGFRALSPVSGTIVSFATSENSVATDGTGSNGPFTEELVKQMNISQPVEVVFKNTRREVMRRTNNTQRPQEWNMLTGDFYFKR
ncbi:MAG TPA: caspase family protein [Bacteroidales bacterium]|nr:caspase family protein [Bacteroidales bacterium]